MVDKDKKNMVKARLLVLSKMFYELTDEAHPMDTFEIIDYLAEHGVPANTKTLRSDIALLKELGTDIVTVPSRPNKYFQGARLFEMPELKLLIDAVNSSRFITDGKSRRLNRKLRSLASRFQREQLGRNLYAVGRIRQRNEKIWYTADLINDAIERGAKIGFAIREFDGNKKRTLRNNGEVYVVSPYAMYWNDDFYYMLGWCDKHQDISAFRVDRMVRPEILDEEALPRPDHFKASDYSYKVFEMFNGEEMQVKLKCRDRLMKYVIDRFGMNVETEPSDGEYFICYADVRLSPTFYGWVFGFGGGIRILEPQQAVDEMRAMANEMLQ